MNLVNETHFGSKKLCFTKPAFLSHKMCRSHYARKNIQSAPTNKPNSLININKSSTPEPRAHAFYGVSLIYIFYYSIYLKVWCIHTMKTMKTI